MIGKSQSEPREWRRRAEELMQGRAPEGVAERALAAALGLGRLPYAAALGARRLAYGIGIKRSERIEGARVISVGNITLGGSGKTPLTVVLARCLRDRGHRVAIVLRGYRSAAERLGEPLLVRSSDEILAGPEAAGDEALLLAQKLPGCCVVVSPRRAEGARLAMAEPHRCDTVLLDDGFQHWGIARDVDLVVLDPGLSRAAWRLFPRGYLREPLSALRRATAFVVFDNHRERALGELIEKGVGVAREKPLLLAARAPAGLIRYRRDGVDPFGGEVEIPEGGFHAFYVAGIARPERVAASLESLGADAKTLGSLPFPDHHDFSEQDLRDIFRAYDRWRENLPEAERRRARLVCTEKDAVKLGPLLRSSDPPLDTILFEVRLIDEPAWDETLGADQER